MPDFIDVYEGALGAEVCRTLIERFEMSDQARRGETGAGVQLALKNSWDIPLHRTPGWTDVEQGLNVVVLEGFKRYVRRYAHVALAPMRLQVQDPNTGA